MRPPLSPQEFLKHISQMPEEKRNVLFEGMREETEKDYDIFVRSFNEGFCSICNKPTKTFHSASPCLHWLLRPKGFKKKHFKLLYECFTYFRISGYVRWIASIDGLFKNVNDIQLEHGGDKVIDFTARYRHISWSFSCSRSDFTGHINTNHGNYPHYHMQMKLNNNQFINYNDFHIPFHEDDIFDFELINNSKEFSMSSSFGPGAGMQELLGTDKGLQYIVDHSEPTDNAQNAAFDLSTIVMAEEGKTISGDLLAEAAEEAKKTGRTMASVMRDKLEGSGVTMSTIVSAGDGVPTPQQRTGGRKRKKK